MKIIEIIVSIAIVVAFIAIVYYVVANPKKVFIDVPKSIFLEVIYKIICALAIIWVPLWAIDRYFKWGVFERIRRFFGK